MKETNNQEIPEELIRGSEIKANWHHGAGAYARCSYCSRYSDVKDSLYADSFLCNCGKSKGWSGSFTKPNKDSLWCINNQNK